MKKQLQTILRSQKKSQRWSSKIIINISKLKLKLKLVIESKLYKKIIFFKNQNK